MKLEKLCSILFMFLLVTGIIFIVIISIIFIPFNNEINKPSSNSNINNYLNNDSSIIDNNAKDVMPLLDSLPIYENIAYNFTHTPKIFWISESVSLVVKYDDETFNREKDKLNNKYKFLDHKVISDYDKDKYFIPEYEFSINTYTFKVVRGNENDKTDFPKSFGMIGVSNEKKSIAYLYFVDTDLDYISSMTSFTKRSFDYKF